MIEKKCDLQFSNQFRKFEATIFIMSINNKYIENCDGDFYMIISLKNLGIVKNASIDLKPLTIFIGENNTGKTWAAYTISSLFGKESFVDYHSNLLKGNIQQKYPPIKKLVDDLYTTGSGKLDLELFLEEYAKKYYSSLCRSTPKRLGFMMGSTQSFFSNVKISLNLSDNLDKMKKNIRSTSMDYSFPQGTNKKGLINVKKNVNDNTIIFYFSENRSKDELPYEIITESVSRIILMLVHRSIYFDIHYLPAERTGIISFLDTFDIKEEKVEIIPNNMDTDSSNRFQGLISLPIANMINALSNLSNYKQIQKIKMETNARKFKLFNDAADILENEVLEGKIEYKSNESGIGSALIYRNSDVKDLELDISIASSTVKDLAPLILYIRYLLEPQSVLIIDEPEMNLHPRNQAKLMEFLVLLVNLKINVIMVTHSPYMVNHLENLIRAFEHEDKDKILNKFYLKKKNAFISKNDVSVYQFTKENVTRIIDKKGNINLKTYSGIAEEIAEIYYDV